MFQVTTFRTGEHDELSTVYLRLLNMSCAAKSVNPAVTAANSTKYRRIWIHSVVEIRRRMRLKRILKLGSRAFIRDSIQYQGFVGTLQK